MKKKRKKKNENNIFYNKKEYIEQPKDNDENKFSFKTESTISKVEIVLKSLVNDFNIIDKNENENNYNCKKINEKGEEINFNMQIIKENDSINIVNCNLINGNNDGYEELFNIIKNIFNIT